MSKEKKDINEVLRNIEQLFSTGVSKSNFSPTLLDESNGSIYKAPSSIHGPVIANVNPYGLSYEAETLNKNYKKVIQETTREYSTERSVSGSRRKMTTNRKPSSQKQPSQHNTVSTFRQIGPFITDPESTDFKQDLLSHLEGLSQDDSISFLRRKLIEIQNPPDIEERPFKLKFTEPNKPYEIAIAALREEVSAQEEELHILTMKVRTRDLKENYEQLQSSELEKNQLEQEKFKLGQEMVIVKNTESLQLANLRADKKTLEELQSDIQCLKDTNSQAELDIQQHTQDIKLAKQQIEILTNERLDTREEIQRLQDLDSTILPKKVDDFNLNLKLNENSKKQKNIEYIYEQITEINNKTLEIKSMDSRMKQEVKLMDMQNEKSSKQIVNNQKQMQGLVEKIGKVKRSNEEKKRVLQDLELKITLNQNDLKILNSEIENEEQLKQRLIENMNQYEMQRSSLQKDYQSQKNTHQIMDRKVDQMAMACGDQLQKKFVSLRNPRQNHNFLEKANERRQQQYDRSTSKEKTSNMNIEVSFKKDPLTNVTSPDIDSFSKFVLPPQMTLSEELEIMSKQYQPKIKKSEYKTTRNSGQYDYKITPTISDYHKEEIQTQEFKKVPQEIFQKSLGNTQKSEIFVNTQKIYSSFRVKSPDLSTSLGVINMNIKPPVQNKIQKNVCEIYIEQNSSPKNLSFNKIRNLSPKSTTRTEAQSQFEISDFDKIFTKQLEDLKKKSEEYEKKMEQLDKHRKFLQKEFGIGKKKTQSQSVNPNEKQVQVTIEQHKESLNMSLKESMNIMSSINQPDYEEFADIVINENSSRAILSSRRSIKPYIKEIEIEEQETSRGFLLDQKSMKKGIQKMIRKIK